MENEDPAQWQSYVKAKALVDLAVRLGQHNQMFSQVVNDPKAPLDELVQLSNGLVPGARHRHLEPAPVL